METRTYTVYKFNELPAESQAKALEKYRYFNVDFQSWDEPILEGAKEDLKAAGFEEAEIFYSGFYSQGDGASFEAVCNLKKLMEGLPKKFNTLKRFVNNERIKGHILKNSYGNRYSHENTRYFEFEEDFANGEKELTDKQRKLLNELQEILEKERYSHSLKIYRSLRQDYEELTGDEAVKDALLSNDYDFTVEGCIDR
jgi:hypothetical protein